MLPHFNKKQNEAIEHKRGPILIIAGAGSGKTHTLTGRLKNLLKNKINPKNIIAITFTNKAAKEMRDRIPNAQNVFIGTFHSLGARILRKESGFLKRDLNFIIFDEDDYLNLIKKILKELDISKDRYNPLIIQNKISTIKNELLEFQEYLDKTEGEIFNQYEVALIKNTAFDFDDLIEKTVKIFQKYPQVLEKYQKQFQHILIDEYQDINTAQYQFIKLLAQKYQNLSVVGDDQQAIYSFRGADFRNFLNFDKDWPTAKIVKLEQNYRSSANIISAASVLIKNNKFQKPKELWTENSRGNPIKIIAAKNAEEEAERITNQLITSNRQPKTTAILYRTNAQSRAIEQSLITANIPYQIFGGIKFYQRKEIKDIIAALRLAFNTKDSVSAERLKTNLPKSTAAYLLEELPRLGKKLSILELIGFFINNSNYFEYLGKKFKNSEERIENINELINFAGEFENLGEFLERVSLLQSSDTPNNILNPKRYTLNAVNLMTIHLAKGLEFNNVFVIGCNEGLLPHQKSYKTLNELEEERRLMYVAMTRAKNELYLSFYGIPSRFLYELPPELTEFISLGNKFNKLPDEDNIYIEDF